jgi:TfoX/Sxy family transcriptional regulator of competence genes
VRERGGRCAYEHITGERRGEEAVMPSWSKISPEQATRFAAALPDEPALERRSMFGCPIAVVNGNMFTGVHSDEINVRLSEADRAQFLADYKGARIFSPMKGMEMKEYVVVPAAVAQDAKVLAAWIRKGFAFAASLPPKKAKPKKVKAGAAPAKAKSAAPAKTKKVAAKTKKVAAPAKATKGAPAKTKKVAARPAKATKPR